MTHTILNIAFIYLAIGAVIFFIIQWADQDEMRARQAEAIEDIGYFGTAIAEAVIFILAMLTWPLYVRRFFMRK